jgi:hypothetical protein
MKLWFVVLPLLLLNAGCRSPATVTVSDAVSNRASSSAPSLKPLKIALIGVGQTNDGGWNQLASQAMKKLEADGNRTESVFSDLALSRGAMLELATGKPTYLSVRAPHLATTSPPSPASFPKLNSSLSVAPKLRVPTWRRCTLGSKKRLICAGSRRATFPKAALSV